jgi:hypothetical protein
MFLLYCYGAKHKKQVATQALNSPLSDGDHEVWKCLAIELNGLPFRLLRSTKSTAPDDDFSSHFYLSINREKKN